MLNLTSLTISSEMLALVAEIDEFRGAWRLLGHLAPERLQRLRKVATIESVGSSTRIEGAQLSNQEVEALLSRLQFGSFLSRDEQEILGYARVMETIFTSHEVIPFNENHVKQLHSMLLQFSDKDARHRGEYKKLPNQVEAFDESGRSVGVIFQTTSPFDTPREMTELLTWFEQRRSDQSLHPLLAIGVFHVVFLAIHPFQDGNGRLARALTTLLLLQAGYGYVPYSSLESVIEQNKESYYLSLRQTQGTLLSESPDWTPWLTFFLQCLQKQKRRLAEKLERESVMRSSLGEAAVSILELVRQHGEVSISDILNATGMARATVKKRLNELVESGHLERRGKGRGTRYIRSRR